MGAWCCKQKHEESQPCSTSVGSVAEEQLRSRHASLRNESDAFNDIDQRRHQSSLYLQSSPERVIPASSVADSETVDRLVLETLDVIGTLVDNEQEPPHSMLKLHHIADKEDGWIQVVQSMVDVIPTEEPLGPSVITLLLDDCPLPSRDSVLRAARLLVIESSTASEGRASPRRRRRNACVVLGCIAEKLAGPSSVAVLSEETLSYLVNGLRARDPAVALHSLVALEKFAQTGENKAAIRRALAAASWPLLDLERWRDDERDLMRRQVGFCAQWCLDNLFLMDGRTYSYERADVRGINAMLNTRDVSEYLKISADGLEARCDAYSFESVRCTASADNGAWYYEAMITTPGVMQIGWATRQSAFLNHEGYGIGDDAFSLAYDGCRRLVWHDARSTAVPLPRWKPGDVLGCLLDVPRRRCTFSLNGRPLPPCGERMFSAASGERYFAAASFMSFQQCRFNFGARPFRYAPPSSLVQYHTFNDAGSLRPEEKVVRPRHLYLDELRRTSPCDDSCTLCWDRRATCRLLPCEHEGFCSTCARQLSDCPMCRAPFHQVLDLDTLNNN